jgi:polyketide biosynthesis 3-hydroxy-3-methylglutaryl-CoA synthase-like enzyme PksG
VSVGIENISAYLGRAFLSISDLFAARGLEASRIENLMMVEKSVSFPCEDAITNAVNAALPLTSGLTENERGNIKLLIVATESGIDFGKSISTYVHHYLKLSKDCRLFEIKQACYGGTAALQMAANTIRAAKGAETRALVIASDDARPASRMTYAEPSQGTGAIAMIVGRRPHVLALDPEASGFCSFEVMDTCRPTGDIETGDTDLSLFSYMDCLSESYASYCAKVAGVELSTTFQFLAFHTPFAGMVKGAHRKLVREHTDYDRSKIDRDFAQRVAPSIRYATRVGNIYSASLFLALCSLLDFAKIAQPSRIGLFSYGSGCSSEFFSGTVDRESESRVASLQLERRLGERVRLSVETYDRLLDLKKGVAFGTKDKKVSRSQYADALTDGYDGRPFLSLSGIEGYHRIYEWS